MVTHIVLWKLHDPKELPAVRKQLESLPERVPGIQRLVVGCPQDPTGPMADISLYTEFATWDDLNRYKVHPEHVKVAEFLKERVSERHVSDYES
jgi:hypothetical protein